MNVWLMRILFAPLLLTLYALGWRPVGKLPDVKKAVVIGAPHTSAWDYAVFLMVACHFGIRPTVLVKEALMRWPLSMFMRFTGGLAVDNRAPQAVVDQVVAMFDQRDEMLLLLSPEGARARTTYWKRGFYCIAQQANVPIIMAFVDFRRKRAGIGPMLMTTGDIRADMAVIREFYSTHGWGLYPDKFGPVRLRSEERVTKNSEPKKRESVNPNKIADSIRM